MKRPLLKFSLHVTVALGLLLVCSGGVARAGYFVSFEFTGNVTQSDFFDIPIGSTYTASFSYYTAGNSWTSLGASFATPITMTLSSGPLSFSEVFTQPEGQGHSGGVVFLYGIGQPYTTTIQAEASIHDSSGSPQYFWLLSFADNSGAAFTQPPPSHFDLSLFPQGGGLMYFDYTNGDIPTFTGPIDSLAGTAVPLAEPTSLTLLGLGSLGLLGYGWRRRKLAVA